MNKNEKVITSPDKFLEFLDHVLPEMFPRSAINKLTNGIITMKTMQNRDSKGYGPIRHLVGAKVCYNKDEFIEWARTFFSQEKFNDRREELSATARQLAIKETGLGETGGGNS